MEGIFIRRWLEAPVMTDEEVTQWIDGPRLNQRGNVVPEPRPLSQRIESMEVNIRPYNPDDVPYQNGKKIVDELKRRQAIELENKRKRLQAISDAEIGKQQKNVALDIVSQKMGIDPKSGPSNLIASFLSKPDVKVPRGGRKTRKAKKQRRKTRKH